ncbi:MAG TPA: PepSY domain-containing protein [Flavobacteriaceae bacterium]|jgi:uncharacterized iron-regulated membrane protein|nr:PepSY domain-containing protein [Flavobacteriaceae bacterium]HBS12526.1 PepSY domain-containing protein [Flavobacteriaceae bacterium]
MEKRAYNILFHTHTVSGIVISVALYIIFFAGSFSFFRNDIINWERNEYAPSSQGIQLDIDTMLDSLKNNYTLYGNDIRIKDFNPQQRVSILLSGSKDSLASDEARVPHFLYQNLKTYKTADYTGSYTLGEFLYRLHFLDQIPLIGRYLSGFTAFFFLFAILTGVLVHWKKIISNFYVFRPWAKLKSMWSDAHTALGMIGLPFQFMYAVTGAYFMIKIVLLVPTVVVIYNSDQKQLLQDIVPESTFLFENKTLNKAFSINHFLDKADTFWSDFDINTIQIYNYGDTNMHIAFKGEADSKRKFGSDGNVIYKVSTEKIISKKNPIKEVTYFDITKDIMDKLHFANYGGYTLKIISFILALVTCFVIISGVQIWLTAREKKNIPIKQKLYNRKVGHIYMAICLTMYPVTALSFIVTKLLPTSFNSIRKTILYSVFFSVWLLLIVFYRFKRDNYFTNKYNLLSGAVLGLLIPLVNGLSTGNWLWKSFQNQQYSIFFIDFFWTILSLISIVIVFKLKRPVPKITHKELLEEKRVYNKLINDTKAAKSNGITSSTLVKKINDMKVKISILWIIIVIGFIIHHIYGLFGVYYNESLMMEEATGAVPTVHHIYRIIFEGLAFFFGILTLEISKKWFKWTSFIWAILLGLFNIYHFVEAITHEGSNISEIFILALMVMTSVFLILNIKIWKNLKE